MILTNPSLTASPIVRPSQQRRYTTEQLCGAGIPLTGALLVVIGVSTGIPVEHNSLEDCLNACNVSMTECSLSSTSLFLLLPSARSSQPYPFHSALTIAFFRLLRATINQSTFSLSPGVLAKVLNSMSPSQ